MARLTVSEAAIKATRGCPTPRTRATPTACRRMSSLVASFGLTQTRCRPSGSVEHAGRPPSARPGRPPGPTGARAPGRRSPCMRLGVAILPFARRPARPRWTSATAATAWSESPSTSTSRNPVQGDPRLIGQPTNFGPGPEDDRLDPSPVGRHAERLQDGPGPRPPPRPGRSASRRSRPARAVPRSSEGPSRFTSPDRSIPGSAYAVQGRTSRTMTRPISWPSMSTGISSPGPKVAAPRKAADLPRPDGSR